MDEETIRQVAWVGDAFVKGAIRGIILDFHGLGFSGLKTGPTTEQLAWAECGALPVVPYYGPWSWMNREARAFVDELVDSLYGHYGLDENLPLISAGGSMGGCAALLYARYARRPITACHAMYPVCDLKYSFSERPDVPATILHAFRGYGQDLDSLLAEHSPLAQVEQMPDIPYLIVHGDKDVAVSKAHHSDRMVAAMRKRGLFEKVEYVEVPGMGHDGPLPIAVIQKRIQWVCQMIQSPGNYQPCSPTHV